MKRNPIENKIWSLRAAGEAFTKAAAATYDIASAKIGEAIFYGALGMLRLAQADLDEEGRAIALDVLDRAAGHEPHHHTFRAIPFAREGNMPKIGACVCGAWSAP